MYKYKTLCHGQDVQDVWTGYTQKQQSEMNLLTA